MTQETVQESIHITDSVTVIIEQKLLYQFKIFVNGIEQEDSDYFAYHDKEAVLACALESVLSYYRDNKIRISEAEISAILLIFKSLNRKPVHPLEYQLLR